MAAPANHSSSAPSRPIASSTARHVVRAQLARATGGAEERSWRAAQALLGDGVVSFDRLRVAHELLRFEPDLEAAQGRAAALQQQAGELGYLPLAVDIAVLRLDLACRAGRGAELERLAPWVESQVSTVSVPSHYPPQRWLGCAAGYDVLVRPQDAERCRQAAWHWLNTTALPNVSPQHRDGFLERNPHNRALRAWAARGGAA